MRSLKGILELLQQHHQRATYGAVAALLGRTPRTVMQGCPRNWLHSWVVNQDTGRPSEYPKGMISSGARGECRDTQLGAGAHDLTAAEKTGE
jgi:hypothetical protein